MLRSRAARSPARTGRTLALAVLATVAVSLVGSAQTNRLRLVSTAWPPFTDGPGHARFALDLVEEAFSRIGVVSTTSIVDPAQFTISLLTGPYDGSAAAWRDPEREKALVYSQPYLENRLILVGRRGAIVNATKLSELKGKKIAIVEGYSYGELDTAGPIYVRSKTEEDSLKQLLDSKVDYTLMDDLVVQYIAVNYATEAQQKLQIGATPLIKRQLYLAVRRTTPDADSIVSRFNSQLRTLIADRTYHRLLHVDWINADVDGDGIPEYVPKSDKVGTVAPQRAYTLISNDKPAPAKPATQQRYYVGGYTYNTWTDLPDSYKVSDDGRKDPKKSTASVFTFTWK